MILKRQQFLLILILTFMSCNKNFVKSNIIGHIENSTQIIDTDMEEIKKEWNSIIKENNINNDLLNFEIRNGSDEGKKYYYLYGFSTNREVKMARLLILNNNKLYFDKDEKLFVVCHKSSLCETCKIQESMDL